MSEFDFNNKTFSLVENTDNGNATSETIFKYKQEGNLITAEYNGGGIKYGKIIAKLENNTLHMLYQCLTDKEELKAGKATAKINLNEKSKIRLTLNWEWLDKNEERGTSEYIEN
ncbi:hypothetical protein [Maribacter algarum]|uniref:hypothetical protein n=1 Tax=Maribacter algarum (ex Zhang et al. 2020) TaxID=2578118 RepID=UPI001485CA92|nr:hypothetical protein [Maribacter algarum]